MPPKLSPCAGSSQHNWSLHQFRLHHQNPDRATLTALVHAAGFTEEVLDYMNYGSSFRSLSHCARRASLLPYSWDGTTSTSTLSLGMTKIM